jgi:hypothetical protein
MHTTRSATGTAVEGAGGATSSRPHEDIRRATRQNAASFSAELSTITHMHNDEAVMRPFHW